MEATLERRAPSFFFLLLLAEPDEPIQEEWKIPGPKLEPRPRRKNTLWILVVLLSYPSLTLSQ